MRSEYKRIFWALLLSGACYVITMIWYTKTKPSSIKNDDAPIAQVLSSNKQVLRKPTSQLIWTPISKNDILYNKELIKTDKDSDVEIEFLDGSTVLNLGPDSLIVVQKKEEQLALELVKGNLSVDRNVASTNGEKKSENIIVKTSGDKSVALSSGSKTNLSRTSSGDTDVEVLKGSAEVVDSTGKKAEITSGKASTISKTGVTSNKINIGIISPNPLALNKIYINQADKNLAFKWKTTLPKSKMSLWMKPIGTKKSEPLKIVKTVDSSSGQLTYPIQEGKYSWKLVATAENSDPNILDKNVIAETMLTSTKIESRKFPVITVNEAKSPVEFEKFPTDLKFSWEKTEEMNQVNLQVSSDPSFKPDSILKQKMKDDQHKDSEVVTINEPGKYYWRVLVKYTDDSEVLFSKPIILDIGKKEQKIVPVTLNFINHNLNKKVYKPATAAEGEQINLSWTATPADVVKDWKLKVYEEGTDPNTIPFQSFGTTLDYKKPVEKTGKYIAILQAFNKNGMQIGKDFTTNIEVIDRPLLVAPEVISKQEPIIANEDGTLKLTTSKVNGAAKYKITLESNGKKKEYTQNSNIFNLKSLVGTYKVSVSSIDEFNRESPPSKPKMIAVPELNALSSPEIKINNKSSRTPAATKTKGQN